MFKLHERLENDTIELGEFDLCKVLLSNDSNYPWVILVPKKDDIKEIHDLTEDEQQTLMKEISRVSHFVKEEFDADKVNIGALGNLVPQLHIHVVARYKDDVSWPGPIWGKAEPIAYTDEQISIVKKVFIPLF